MEVAVLTPSPIYLPSSCRRMPLPETPRSLAARLIRRRDVHVICELTALALFVGGVLAASLAAGG